MRNHHRRTTTSKAMIASLALALFLVACGDPGSDAAVEVEEPDAGAQETEDEPDVPEDATEQPPVEEPTDEDASPDESSNEPAASSDTADDPVTSESCAIASGSRPAPGEEDYLDIMEPINGDMEELVYEMEASLVAFEDGTADGSSLQADLQAQAQRWQRLVDAVDGVTPPAGAEQWHERVLDSWVSVCEAIDDGYQGSAEDDSDRFDDFVAALRDFPSLLNDLHANAACGPFETC